jgi:asparagine synthase (glutamine-hydrolysing)
MCGIAGIINFDKKAVEERQLELMHRALSHRGPDGSGVYSDKNVGLAHSRLKIIDLSESARQPMPNEDKSVWVVFNGEIYNYNDFKPSLLAKGHRFLSNSDTEVLVHLYEEEGINFIHKLNGMFAFCIYDKKRIFLVRDRIGIKPLYYYADDKKFLFASEIKSILACGQVDRTIDFSAISEYLSLAYIPSPKTAFKKIRKLKAGQYLELDPETRKFKMESYWDFKPGHNRDENEAESQIMHSLMSSVKMRLISDVPLGAFLSGGIDSSIIVALMAKSSNKKPKTFTIGFADEPRFDETFYAKKVSEMYDTDHTEIKLRYEDVIDDLPGILDSFDEPFADSSALPTFMVSKATRHHVKVALSGDGGDELFGGYNKYIGMMAQRSPFLFPEISGRLFRAAFGTSLESFDSEIFGRFKRRMRKMINGMGRGDVESHLSWMVHLTKNEKKRFLNPSLEDTDKKTADAINYYYTKYENDWVNKASYADLKLQLVDDMLAKVDKMSMLTSLEVRVPFLDHTFANKVFGLSGNLKIKGRRRKYILLKTAEGLLPRELHKRPKKGFEIPVGPWFKKNKKFRELFMDCMNTEKEGIVNSDNAIKLFNMHEKGPIDYNRELWILFVLKWWSCKYA